MNLLCCWTQYPDFSLGLKCLKLDVPRPSGLVLKPVMPILITLLSCGRMFQKSSGVRLLTPQYFASSGGWVQPMCER